MKLKIEGSLHWAARHRWPWSVPILASCRARIRVHRSLDESRNWQMRFEIRRRSQAQSQISHRIGGRGDRRIVPRVGRRNRYVPLGISTGEQKGAEETTGANGLLHSPATDATMYRPDTGGSAIITQESTNANSYRRTQSRQPISTPISCSFCRTGVRTNFSGNPLIPIWFRWGTIHSCPQTGISSGCYPLTLESNWTRRTRQICFRT